MILADSRVWIDFFRNVRNRQTAFLADHLASEESFVVIGDLILMEILQGAKDDAHARRIANRLSILPEVAICDAHLARAAASNYRRLRAHGITVRKTIDTLIATRCIVDDYALLYSDRDFDPFVEHLGLRSAMA
ncbi:MAG: PIN domain nuclease [Pseudomonadota bacterium]